MSETTAHTWKRIKTPTMTARMQPGTVTYMRDDDVVSCLVSPSDGDWLVSVGTADGMPTPAMLDEAVRACAPAGTVVTRRIRKPPRLYAVLVRPQ